MGVEIERKFLVRADLLPALPAPLELTQGYLSTAPAVRVRLAVAPDGTRSGELTIKGPGLVSRAEFNYPLPPPDADELLGLCGRSLRKRRHRLGRWEIDLFPDHPGPGGGVLWLAEIELKAENEPFDRPPWLGPEVTHDPSYANAALARPRR
ncbi:MAG: CYTH domain-containing protein [Myxococcales bacterium]